jgi:hypothetical protein
MIIAVDIAILVIAIFCSRPCRGLAVRSVPDGDQLFADAAGVEASVGVTGDLRSHQAERQVRATHVPKYLAPIADPVVELADRLLHGADAAWVAGPTLRHLVDDQLATTFDPGRDVGHRRRRLVKQAPDEIAPGVRVVEGVAEQLVGGQRRPAVGPGVLLVVHEQVPRTSRAPVDRSTCHGPRPGPRRRHR